jgi:hypothetical protein
MESSQVKLPADDLPVGVPASKKRKTSDKDVERTGKKHKEKLNRTADDSERTASASEQIAMKEVSEFECSNDEEQHNPREFIIRFGKCKGQRLGDITKTKAGRDYLRYLLTWSELRAETRSSVSAMLRVYEKSKGVKLAGVSQ